MLSGPLLVLVVGVLNTVSAVQNWPITAPVANEVVLVARPYTIRWNNDTKGPVSITLNYNQQPVILTSSTVNNGTFVWTPASVYAGNYKYYLSICDVNLDSGECSVTYHGRFHVSLFSSSSSQTQTQTTSSTSLTTSSSLRTTRLTTTTSSTTSSSPTPTTSTTHNSTSGLATGGVVGTTVGTTVAVLALVSLLLWVYKRTRRTIPTTSEPPAAQINQHLSEGYNKPELSTEIPSANDFMRIHGQFVGPTELHTERGPYELGGSSSR